MKYVFLLGANDLRTAKLSGFDANQKVAYDWDGHTEFARYLRVPEADKEFWYLLWFAPDAVPVSEPVIVINTIANADIMKEALARASNIVRSVGVRWPSVVFFNRPDLILETARDRIYERFHALPGLVIPRTIRFQPLRVRDVEAMAEREGLTFPYIVRRAGGHGGMDMVLVETPADSDKLERFAFNGDDYYMTQYYDYRDADGLYTKTRFVMLGGKLYPRHSITSDHWAVHARSRGFMAGRDDLKDRERETLATLQHSFSAEALASVRAIGDALGLDYVGFDGCLLPDGRFLIFEINASQNAMAPSDYKTFPYLESYVEAIIDGFNAHVAAKCRTSGL